MTTESLSEVMTLQSASEEQTAAIGETLGKHITGGLCVCVTGSLGSGKSALVRGICRGLGVDESVASPSFILCEEYRGRLPVLHSDLYRLEHESEIEDIGLFDRVDGRCVVLVEWGDRSPRLMRDADVIVDLAVTGEDQRRIRIHYRPDNTGVVGGL
jgi:tRNA threonylcarbamoyladenosine biosynthesis protein TsaE